MSYGAVFWAMGADMKLKRLLCLQGRCKPYPTRLPLQTLRFRWMFRRQYRRLEPMRLAHRLNPATGFAARATPGVCKMEPAIGFVQTDVRQTGIVPAPAVPLLTMLRRRGLSRVAFVS